MNIIQTTQDLFTLLESYIQQDVMLQQHQQATPTNTTSTTIPKSIRASYFLSTLINEFKTYKNL